MVNQLDFKALFQLASSLAASREALRALRFLFAACAALPCLFVFGTLLVTLNRRERERVKLRLLGIAVVN